MEEAKPKGWRKAFGAALAALYGILAATAFVLMPKAADAFGAVKVPLPAPAELGLRVVTHFRMIWPVYGVVMGALGFFGMTGAMDKLIKPFTILVVFLCVGAAGLAIHVHYLPDTLAREAQERGIDFFRPK